MLTCGTLVRWSAVSGESKVQLSIPGREEMEQRLGHWIALLHERAPGSVGDLLRFQVGPCDPEAGVYCFYASTEDWMRNAFGSLHGGMITTVLDQGMGMLATCLMNGTAITPTVQMNVIYHRPLSPGDKLLLRIHVETMTRTLIHMRAEAMNALQNERLCVTATGMFYIKPIEV